MDALLDKIICRGFTYECEIGFHTCEERLRQKISLDLVAWVAPIPAAERDLPAALRFDYFEANRELRELLGGQRYSLIETLAEAVAAHLLARFRIAAIEVGVTKFPLGMPNAGSVTYVCRRGRAVSDPG